MRAENTNGPLARAGCTNESRQPHRSNAAGESQSLNPANLDSERCILGSIIEDDDLVMPSVIASSLKSVDFFLSGHRRVFDAMLQLWREKKHIDLVLVTERLGNRPEDAVLVASLIQGIIVHPDHVSTHIEIVRDKAQRRALLKLSEWIPNVINDPSPADALIEQAIQRLEALAGSEVRA